MSKYIITLFAGLMFVVSCGDSVITTAQNFVPNNTPVIQNITVVLPSGVDSDSIANGMTIRITVQAHDPEGKTLDYTFTSAAGIFSNIVVTDTGCTAELYTMSVTGNSSVYMTVTAKDEKGASDTWSNYNLGTGRSGPKVDITANPDDYIKPSADTGFEFSSSTEGYYQIRCDNSATAETIAVNYDDPVYMYVPSGDLENPKTVSVIVAGLTSTSSGKVKLATDNASNKVWLIFWDGLKQYDIKCLVITQDSIVPAFTEVTPSGEDNGVNSNVEIAFSEPVQIMAGGFTVKDSFNNDVTSRFGAAAVTDNVVSLAAGSALDYYETYMVTATGDLVVTDRAGNECETSSSISGTFITQALGTLAKPVFRYAGNDNTVAGGTVFDYAVEQSVRAVYTGAESDVSINWTLATGGTPGDPAVDYSKTSNETIPFSKNSGIIAKACKKGYVSNADSLSVKIKAKTPVITPTGTASGDYYAGVYNSLTVTITGDGGESFLCSATTDGSEPGTPSTSGSPDVFNTHGSRVRVNAQAISDNMEPSDIATAGIWRVRNRVVPYTEVITDAEPSKMPWTGVAISSDGTKIAAVENKSVQLYSSRTGYIWLSTDSGVNWTAVNNTVNSRWSCVAMSDDGSTIVAGITDGYIYTRQVVNEIETWDTNNSITADWTSVAITGAGDTIYAAGTGLDIYKMTGSGDWAVDNTGGNNSGAYNWTGITVSINTGWAFAVENSVNKLHQNDGVTGWGAQENVIDIWCGIASIYNLSTGKHNIAAIAADGFLYTFSHYNATPVAAESVGKKSWSCVVTANNESCLAGVTGGGIWQVDFGREMGTDLLADYESALNKYWCGLAATSGYARIAAIASEDYLYLTDDLFASYRYNGPRLWTALASSADGVHLAGAVYNGSVYVSHDSGATWTKIENPSEGNSQWIAITVNSDGTKIAAIDNLNIFVWSDGTWVNKNPGGLQKGFTGLSMSADGNTLFASASNYYYGGGAASNLWISDDCGSSWYNPALSANQIWRGVAMSADGSVKAAIADTLFDTDKIVRICKNGEWTNCSIGTVTSLSSVAVSPDGNYIAVTETSGDIYISSDSGVTWTNMFSSAGKSWKGVTISNGGNVINAICSDGKVFTLYDLGSSWTLQEFAGEEMWSCIAATSDGFDIIAGSFGANNPVILR